MVKKRHDAVRGVPEISFAAPVGTPAGVEVLPLAELRRRVPAERLTAPQRPDFHHLIVVTGGTLWHTVDFTAYALEPGSWLWVRPGQVQQWGDLTHAEGTLVLFREDFLDQATAAGALVADPHAPNLRRPLPEDAQALRLAADHLAAEFRALGRLPLEIHTAALRHLLAVLVLRLAHLTAPVGSPVPEPDATYLRFRDAVERDFARTRRVEDYALALGYSARTLARATLAAAGLGAKEFIDRRVVLEAKRLLAHSDQSAARIADRLGFSSATHFNKYFHQRTGQTPIAFRDTVRGRSPS
ncbi:MULTISPECIES: AraC family transcriptional regulator [Streptomyces]|uniref:Transcriptional regulator n=1 Tax=Streptomyces sviceus (strain ATCC 29083 / DSM 924 / JCM 4929 / NBRC 13980 / NCIMB 11184 / NRRL 5439 / UC 5370) TaxID=463191 RepID=B5HLM2_STRX2|nr:MULTISPECIES: AraC family transcriptional regulator [Streptomyces]EDY53727.1 transcriptional regulator [Streptomyces sviceus ATCC 29083]MYT06688.1 helix-turn-helix domain-containing protein [Streptomyces sp. SID5470]